MKWASEMESQNIRNEINSQKSMSNEPDVDEKKKLIHSRIGLTSNK